MNNYRKDGKPRYDDLDENEEAQGGPSEDYVAKMNELMNRAEPMILSVNSSFNMYAAGVEIRPPTERFNQLEQMMLTLTMMAKPTPAYRFRFQNLQSTYNTYKRKWEKLLQDIESGKIKRFAGPKRNR
ncbi:MAG: hypothetical protein NDJ89_18015 [Oligoflexia bacterium]|nr:hypothetical protein [Oligoflexia bacterium]